MSIHSVACAAPYSKKSGANPACGAIRLRRTIGTSSAGGGLEQLLNRYRFTIGRIANNIRIFEIFQTICVIVFSSSPDHHLSKPVSENFVKENFGYTRIMSIREEYERREKKFMSPFGCLSSESRGRAAEEKPCSVRTAFQLDRDRILTHTLEVAQMARAMARALFLNEDLVEAIALAHDLGHTPFGHSGETVLKEIYSADFSHNEQSLRVVEVLENNGTGLNLSAEVRDGILKHSKGYGKIIPDDPAELADTYEGRIARIADIMAYLNHDLEDAIRSGVIRPEQVPDQCTGVLGATHSERAETMIRALIASSQFKDGELKLEISEDVYSAMTALRQFLYDYVYRSPRVHQDFEKAKKMLSELYAYFLENEELLHQKLTELQMLERNHNHQPRERTVCDLIASMTDRYAMNLYQKIFFPSPVV
jgi:dGTPase